MITIASDTPPLDFLFSQIRCAPPRDYGGPFPKHTTSIFRWLGVYLRIHIVKATDAVLFVPQHSQKSRFHLKSPQRRKSKVHLLDQPSAKRSN